MPTKKKGKKVRDPSAYSTVSVPSSRVKHSVESPLPQPVTLVEKPVTENANDVYDDNEEALTVLENQMQEAVGDKNLVDAWVSIDLARKQAEARIRSETKKKKLDKSGPTVWLSQKSEQLLIEQIRTEHLVLPTPHVEAAVLSLRDWTRSANFIYETLVAYAFAEDDIARAMAATRGAGDLVDVVAWLCFHVPADKMPVDMRDKLEHGLYGKLVKLEQPKVAQPPLKEIEPFAKARIDQIPVVAAVERAKEADQLLAKLLRDRMLDTDGADEYDSDADPSAVHAWRVVRVNACSEILAFYRNSSIVKGFQKKANVDAIMAIITRETKLISVLEDDVLFVGQSAAREYDRLWQEYYGPLLEDIRNLETSYHNSEEASVNPVSVVLAGQEKIGQRQEPADIDILANSDSDKDDNVVGFGLDLFLGSDNEENSATAQSPTASSSSTVRVINTTEPAGWSGAAVKDLVMEVVRRLDKQADIRYQTMHRDNGYTCKLSIRWSQPAKAKQAMAGQRQIPVASTATDFEQSGLTHAWQAPRNMFGKTKRVAADLAALVFLYMQHSLCHNIALRLTPALHAIWAEWEAARLAATNAAKEGEVAQRIEFLRGLRKQYEDAAENDKYGEDGEEEAVGLGSSHVNNQPDKMEKKRDRVRRMRQTRSQLWSGKTLAARKSSHEWKTKYDIAQKELPARKNASAIRQAIQANQTVIIRGETGSGKSSQVPQFVLEHLLDNAGGGYKGGRVLCTQPRRISAVSIATRVSQELGDAALGTRRSLVGVQIRFNSQACVENALVFCTTGVLLRMLIDDPELRDVGCIICDEVQERTLELDYMLIIVRKLLRKRPDLKVVLMSATIDTRIFSCYFDGCPVVEIPGRTFPVSQVFLEDAVRLSGYAIQSHSKYAQRRGFYQRESVVERMRTDIVNLELIHLLVREICIADSRQASGQQGDSNEWQAFCMAAAPSGSVLVFLPGIYEIRALYGMLVNDRAVCDTNTIIPLHSSFANDIAPGTSMTYTDAAFAPPPQGMLRKIVLSTNVAETGITIPDITVVVDCGLSNQTRWDKERRLTRLEKRPISKANVRQRCGRAGRVQPGLAVCLYTTQQHLAMADFELPEMQRMSLANMCLQTKAHGFKDIMYLIQQAPEPPQPSSVMQAIFELQEAGALDEDEELTPIGRHLCYMPVDLSVGKLLVIGTMFGCLDPILTIAASMSTNTSVLLAPFASDSRYLIEAAHKKYRTRAKDILPYVNDANQISDFLVVLAAYEDWRRLAMQPKVGKERLAAFCQTNCLSMDGLEELEECRKQYLQLLGTLGLVNASRSSMSKNSKSGFDVVPAAVNQNGDNVNMIYASIVAGLNHVLMPIAQPPPKYTIGQTTKTKRVEGIGSAIQIVDRERVATRPIDLDNHSVAASIVADVSDETTSRPPRNNVALVAATISGNKSSMTAHTLTKVNLAALVLFARSLTYWPKAQRLVINKWIDAKCFARTASALMVMRRLLDRIMQFRFAFPQHPLPRNLERWQAAIVNVIKNESV
ncbi:hypothetical protein GGI23_000148 [Coemansia sp. RSA 2559]|nr:hypothetical protein GGI23_000148 [Coemansia sp. RSA 2559]KAJ2869628.1 hypothetical protein GGI22_000146 [Coemansia erecta]